jgi:hypothetical protein
VTYLESYKERKMAKIRKISDDSISVDELIVKTTTHNKNFLLAKIEDLQAEIAYVTKLLNKIELVKDDEFKLDAATVSDLKKEPDEVVEEVP